jgi:hypothetical protein
LLLATTELAQKSVTLDPFVGRWKEDVSKRTFAGDPPLVFQKGVKNIEEVRGSEVAPLVQQVIFDGKPEPFDRNLTVSWRQLDANTFERKLTEKGRLVATRTIRMSA